MTVSVRIEGKKAKATSGQIKHDTREGKQPGYVDDEKSKLNSVLIDPMAEKDLKHLCEERRIDAGAKRKMRSDAAVSQIGIITFGTEAQKTIENLTPEEQDRLFKNAAKTAANHCENEITGLVVHRDESAIHAHFQMPAICKDGQPQSKKGIDFSVLQDRVSTSFAHLSIERGTKKADRIERGEPESAHIHRSVKQLHEDLPKEIKAAQKRLDKVFESKLDTGIKPTRVQVVQKRKRIGHDETKSYDVYEASKVDKILKDAAAKTSRAAVTEAELNNSTNHAERLKRMNTKTNLELKGTSQKLAVVIKTLALGSPEDIKDLRQQAIKAVQPTKQQSKGMER